MRVFQTRHVGAAPTCRTIPPSSRSVRDHARHFAEVEARGANPRGSAISNTLHIVTVSIPRCERGGAGASALPLSGIFQREAPYSTGEANPAVGTISFISCAWRSRRASGSQVHVTQCESGAHVQFHRIRESQRTRLVWDQDRPGAAPGYPTNFGL